MVGNGPENGKEPEANVPQLPRHTGHGGPRSATLVTTVTEAGFAGTCNGPVALGNVEAVDVTRNGTAHDGFQYDVTFTTDLGPRPLLEILVGGAGVSPADAWVSRVQEGVTETQIIVLSSLSQYAPVPNRAAYNASKHALHGLFETLRGELSDTGVHVMLVCPGYTATDLRKNVLVGDGSTAPSPVLDIGRVASPQDVAEAIYHGALKRRRLHTSLHRSVPRHTRAADQTVGRGWSMG